MPHCIIEYSSNLSPALSLEQLVESVHLGALESDLFELDDIKTRATSYEHFKLGGDTEHFIHVTVRLLSGRTQQQKNRLSQLVLKQLADLELLSISLSVEVCDINRETYAKQVLT